MLSFNDLIIVNRPYQSAVADAVSRVIDSGWFILGKECEAFEAEFAAYIGVSKCLGVGNGTDAIEIGLRSIGVKSGTKVATVANAGNYTSTALQIIGAKPIFIDINSDTLLMDFECLEEQLRKTQVDVVVATHLFGRMVDMPRLRSMADRHKFLIFEDCAQAHGAELNSQKAGSFGDAASFSFYPTKNLGALGDGGAVVCNSLEVADRIKKLRQYGWSSKYQATVSHGRNSRLDEIQAAVLRVKLPKLDEDNARRKMIAGYYSETIKSDFVHTPQQLDLRDVSHLYVVRTGNRDGLRHHLAERGIQTDIHYPVLDFDQAGQSLRESISLNVVAKKMAVQILSLPCYPGLLEENLAHIATSVNSWNGK